jgi:hypothetical protein
MKAPTKGHTPVKDLPLPIMLHAFTISALPKRLKNPLAKVTLDKIDDCCKEAD